MHKKRNKKKLSKGSLIILGFLFICLSFFDLKADKNNTEISLNNSIYTNVNAKELINIIKSQKGLLVIADNEEDIKRLVDLLVKENSDERIFVYNSSLDKPLYDMEYCTTTRKATNDYKRLVNELGSYSESYTCRDEEFKYINDPMVLFAKDGGIIYSYYLPEEDVTDNVLSYVFEMGFKMLNS